MGHWRAWGAQVCVCCSVVAAAAAHDVVAFAAATGCSVVEPGSGCD